MQKANERPSVIAAKAAGKGCFWIKLYKLLMAALKQMTPVRISGSLLLIAWFVWLFNYSIYYFAYSTFAYALTISVMLACWWLVHLVSNQNFGLRIVVLLVPYLLWLYWLVQQGLEVSMPNLFAGLTIVGVCAFIAVCFSMAGSMGKPDQQLLMHGEKASAKVLAVKDTNVTLYGNQFLLALTVEVLASSKGSFIAELQAAVSRVNLPRVGDTVTILFDPKQPENIAMLTQQDA